MLTYCPVVQMLFIRACIERRCNPYCLPMQSPFSKPYPRGHRPLQDNVASSTARTRTSPQEANEEDDEEEEEEDDDDDVEDDAEDDEEDKRQESASAAAAQGEEERGDRSVTNCSRGRSEIFTTNPKSLRRSRIQQYVHRLECGNET